MLIKCLESRIMHNCPHTHLTSKTERAEDQCQRIKSSNLGAHVDNIRTDETGVCVTQRGTRHTHTHTHTHTQQHQNVQP